MMSKTLFFLINIPKNLALLLIRVYQKTLSADHSFWANPEKFRICIFYPSCSQYTYEAIEKYGIIIGSVLGAYRILRCNGFSKGGFDPIPEDLKMLFNKKKRA
jgi:uncharacterized protein